ncbi:MAG TPA: hypothetical protein VIJ63_16420 [Roseiarcus sp.]
MRRFFERVGGAADENVAICNDGARLMRHQSQFKIRQQLQNFIRPERVERGHARIKDNGDLTLIGHMHTRAKLSFSTDRARVPVGRANDDRNLLLGSLRRHE